MTQRPTLLVSNTPNAAPSTSLIARRTPWRSSLALVAVLLSAGRRVAAVWKPAALGALVGIAVRMGGHMLLA